MNAFTDTDLSVVLIAVLLFACLLLISRWGPKFRLEIRANRFGRWRFTYLLPLGPAFLVAGLVVLALADWLPRFLPIGVSDPIALRIVGTAVFIPMYVWQVLGWRKFFREQESGSLN